MDHISLSSHFAFLCLWSHFRRPKVCSSSCFWFLLPGKWGLLKEVLCRLLLGRTSSCSLVDGAGSCPSSRQGYVKEMCLALAVTNPTEVWTRGATQCPRSGWQTREPGCNGAKAAKRSLSNIRGQRQRLRGATHVWCQGGGQVEQHHIQERQLCGPRRGGEGYSMFEVRRGDCIQGKEQWLG